MKHERLFFAAIVLSAVASAIWCVTECGAGVPRKLNYQGKLTAPAGTLVADGAYDMVFSLYDAETGGTEEWTETWDSGTSKVQISNGLFNVPLGAHTPIGLPFDESYWIEMRVKYGGSYETLLPRQPLASAGYAVRAELADTAQGLSSAGVGALSPPQGFLINGKIVPTVASGNLTVAIKTLAGTDPSAGDPVYVRIGDTVRSSTSALSVTAAAGTSWCNAGSSELATKEIDYFVYLEYETSQSAVRISFSRIPSAHVLGDFHATATNEKAALSNRSATVNTDTVELIGRFAATLSAGAGYTWSVPTFTPTNLIQRPMYETRWLPWAPTVVWTAGAAPSTVSYSMCKYKICNQTCTSMVGTIYANAGTTVTKVSVTTPMAVSASNYQFLSGTMANAFTPVATLMEFTNAEPYAMWCTSATIDRYGFQVVHEI